MTNWENIYKQYDKWLMLFTYDSINKKTTNVSKEKWAQGLKKDIIGE